MTITFEKISILLYDQTDTLSPFGEKKKKKNKKNTLLTDNKTYWKSYFHFLFVVNYFSYSEQFPYPKAIVWILLSFLSHD